MPLSLSLTALALLTAAPESPVALIPKATGPVTLDGKLDKWAGAFVAPVHVGHPDFANRGAQLLLMWDEQNLYVGLRCLDRTPAHVMPDNQLWNGDAVEFYLDARAGEKLGAREFGPGTLHLFFTGFTGTEVKPRVRLRDLPEFKGMTLQGAEAAAQKTPWGYTVEFKLPWANCPGFTPKAGADLGMECELCSSDGGPRVDRTFTFASPAAVGSPSAFGRVKLVDKLAAADLAPCARALLPVSVTQSANYPWLYVTAGLSPTLGESVKPSARLLDKAGTAKQTATFTRKTFADSPLSLWQASFELFDLAPGDYTLEVTAGLVQRRLPIRHGASAAPPAAGQQRSPMSDSTRPHERLKPETPAGRREKLALGVLFVPEGAAKKGRVPLFVHFHGSTWLPEVAAARHGLAVVTVQLGSGSGVYGRAFADPAAFANLLHEAEAKAGLKFDPVGLTAWSAGYGAVRAILKRPENVERVAWVVLLDGLHAGYAEDPAAVSSPRLVETDLEAFVNYAREATAGRKRFLVTHSEVFPGTFASTTETADYLLGKLGLHRRPVLKAWPLGMQQLSEAGEGGFRVLGFAGNSAPDHVDQLHALPEFLRLVRE